MWAMGGALSWLRGGKEDSEKILKELDEKIVVQRQALEGYISSHAFLRGWLLKVFVPVQVALAAWFYLRKRPAELLLQLRDAGYLLAWPAVCFMLKKGVDTYYGMRVRRDESKLRALFDQQVKELRSIEEDPAFKRQMELLQKYSRNVPDYTGPGSVVRQRPVAAANKTPQRAAEQQQQQQVVRQEQPKMEQGIAGQPATPVPASSAVRAEAPIVAPSPKTPKMYTQPVGRLPPLPPVLTPAKSGGLFQTFLNVIVGDGPSLGAVMTCAHCKAHNGLEQQSNVPDVWACKVCGRDNTKAKE